MQTQRSVKVFRPREVHRVHHSDTVSGSTVTPDGKYLITNSKDSLALVTEIGTWELIHQVKHQSSVYHSLVSPDGKYLIAPWTTPRKLQRSERGSSSTRWSMPLMYTTAPSVRMAGTLLPARTIIQRSSRSSISRRETSKWLGLELSLYLEQKVVKKRPTPVRWNQNHQPHDPWCQALPRVLDPPKSPVRSPVEPRDPDRES